MYPQCYLGELKFKDESMAGVQATNVNLANRLAALDKTTKAALNIGSSSSITSDSPSSTPPPSKKSNKKRKNKHLLKK